MKLFLKRVVFLMVLPFFPLVVVIIIFGMGVSFKEAVIRAWEAWEQITGIKPG